MVTEEKQRKKYYSVREVAQLTGLTRQCVNYRILTDGITTFIDPTDRRRRLITAEDVEKLIELRPAPQRTIAA